jgi:probable HAF family extracellular repeat protein
MKFRNLSFPLLPVTVGIVASVLAWPVGLAAPQQLVNSRAKAEHRRYKLVDLGTLGGPVSYFSEGGIGARVLNNGGTVAGYADIARPDPSAPNCFNLDCFLSHTFRWEGSVLADLGTTSGANTSAASGINELGWIVGVSSAIDPKSGVPHGHAALWKDHLAIDLGTLGGTDSNAIAINNHGQIVGFSTNTIPDPFDPFGFATQLRAFIWEKGVMKDLGSLGGPDSAPGAIFNERGQVAGSSYINFVPNPATGVPTADPFLWEDGHMIDLGTFGGTNGFALAVNEHGQVIGQSNLPGDQATHAFLWDRGSLMDLGTLGGTISSPAWFNEQGAVVGLSTTEDDRAFLAFLWRNGAMTNLGTVAGDSCSAANSINAKGQIVGVSGSCDFSIQHAFLWEGGEMVDLNALIPVDTTLQLVAGLNINDRGEIVGEGVPLGFPLDTDFFGHLFVLIPCDENHPNIEGCDYDPLNTDVSLTRTHSAQASAMTDMSPNEVRSRIHGMSRRNGGFRGLQPK